MPEILETLRRLEREFVVGDLMLKEENLVCARDASQATGLLGEHPDFDVIPIRAKSGLIGFVERGTTEIQPITVNDLVTEGTSIIDAVDLLSRQRRFFVLVQNHIGGYVHFSDLNLPVVKLPFFVLLESVERRLFDSVGCLIQPEVLQKIVSAERLTAIVNKMRYLKEEKAELQNWAALLYFDELLKSARALGKITVEIPEIDALAKVRNLVCHAASAGLLVEKYSDVARLASAKRICFRLLEQHPNDL